MSNLRLSLCWALVLGMILAAGCAPSVVPPQLMKQVDRGLTLAQARDNPAQAVGKTVLWGGRIIRTVNRPKGTLIEVLQLPLDSQERPEKGYNSSGRFIVAMHGFLDPEIYHKNREVTVVGTVLRVEMLPLGQIKYKYVLLRGKELKLWDKRPDVVQVYPLGGFWGPMPPPLPGSYPYWYYGPYPWW